jgi:hypothetical protein
MPRPAEIEVEECAAPNGSYSLSPRLAQGANPVAPPGQDFVRVGLMPDVPQQPVARGIEDRVDRDGQFHHTERGAQMAAGDGDGVDGFSPQFIRELTQLLRREISEIGRVPDAIQ